MRKQTHKKINDHVLVSSAFHSEEAIHDSTLQIIQYIFNLLVPASSSPMSFLQL
jgi:hypothetical protein